jgi:hypothetical protein
MTRTGVTMVTGLLACLLVGCGGAKLLPEPVEISGTVTTADGKPVKDVQLGLRPRGAGHPAGCALGADGAFKVSAIPGEFVFFFAPLEDPKADKAKAKAGFAAIPKPYQEATAENVVTLSAGGGNKIQLK